MNKRLAGAAAALVIVGGGAAVSVTAASAQGDSTTTTDAPSTTVPAKPTFDREAKLKAALDPLVKDSTLTQAQEDKVIAALKAAEPAKGPGFGKGGMRGPGFGAEQATVAKALGLTTDELMTELRSGKSIATIAKEKGVNLDAVVKALVDEQTARLDAAVTAGKMTQADADARKADLTQRITDRLNQAPGQMRGFGHGRRGHDGPDAGSGSSSTAPDTTAPATTAPAAN